MWLIRIQRWLLVRAAAGAMRKELEPGDVMRIITAKAPGTDPAWRLAVIDDAVMLNLKSRRARKAANL